jgi:hypothetical protein
MFKQLKNRAGASRTNLFSFSITTSPDYRFKFRITSQQFIFSALYFITFDFERILMEFTVIYGDT